MITPAALAIEAMPLQHNLCCPKLHSYLTLPTVLVPATSLIRRPSTIPTSIKALFCGCLHHRWNRRSLRASCIFDPLQSIFSSRSRGSTLHARPGWWTMDAVQTPKPTIIRDRGHSDGFSTRPRTSHRENSGNGASTQSADENRSPANMPKALSTMLKTTTETGDIGMFSIKPPRVPSSLATPRRIGSGYSDMGMQRQRPHFQPYGVPKVDDRRRLPSYARDTTSDNLSMYDSTSQRSAGGISEEPDYRSYSMTQTYSAYALSNHRSYTSLRSQPDMNALVQRPRSPFAYPARLKRPGFRPSSPALTDGGGVDYRRRAEIDRLPYGSIHNTSSPSSLYADRRKPPLSLRPEGNRSTPSLLSQPSPPRRSSTPQTLRSNGPNGNDWYRRNGPPSVNTSPARSTLSLASTANLYANPAPPSTTTTPGKVHPPSPLYYDYTEDFDVETYTRPETIDRPPQFCITQTIYEDPSTHSERLPTLEASNHTDGLTSDHGQEGSNISDVRKSPGEAQLDGEGFEHLVQFPGQDNPDPKTASPDNQEGHQRDRKTIRLSGLGYGAQELSSHVEEVFGLLSSESFEIQVTKDADDHARHPTTLDNSASNQANNQLHRQPHGNPSHSQTNFSTTTSTGSYDHFLGRDTITGLDGKQDSRAPSAGVSSSSEPIEPPHQSNESRQTHLSSPSQNTLPCNMLGSRVRSSGFYSIDTGLSELAELISSFEEKNGSRIDESSGSLTIPGTSPLVSPPWSNNTAIRMGSNRSSSPSLPSHDSLSVDENHLNTQLPQNVPFYRQSQRPNLPQLSEYDSLGPVPNFSHQNPHKVIPRSESPMLAPKPISPARQLKLKNSIPQLMKALPPIPPEPLLRPASPSDTALTDYNVLPSGFAERPSDVRNTPIQTTSQVNKSFNNEGIPSLNEIPRRELEGILGLIPRINVEKIPENDISDGSKALPRMKLKMRTASTMSPLSTIVAKSREMDTKYPWPDRKSSAHVQNRIIDEEESSKPPRFKLKVARATNVTLTSANTVQDTVRVNRASAESIGLQLQNPKDLFTSSGGVENLFRQVNKHLHARRESVASLSAEEALASTTTTPSSRTPTLSLMVEAVAVHSPALSQAPNNGIESRSVFSDDSSHARRSLRKRLSNLRARIAAPYMNRAGTQSHDDITWKDRNGGEAQTPSATRSIPNLQQVRSSTEVKPTRRLTELMHRQNLKAKLQEWLRGAKAVFTTRSKTRCNAVESGGDM